jgi:hypothetical protein
MYAAAGNCHDLDCFDWPALALLVSSIALTCAAADKRQSTKPYFVALLIAAIAMLCDLYGPPPLIGSTR